MASARKKQDEKHLKILRELVSLPVNKQCFDCHQRGPTYINMTIGSFVCTSCSGMLRGLTPPHRVKSISMASFNPEEVELIKSRGNEYCRRIWMGLYDTNHAHETKDEQQIKDFMIAKYEKKRYYLEPSVAIKNNGSVGFSPPGTQSHSRTSTPTHIASTTTTTCSTVTTTTTVTSTASDFKPLSSLLGPQAKSLTLNVQTAVTTSSENMFTPDKPSNEFLADFGSADPFSSSSQSSTATEASFANFENNPIFNSSNDVNFGFSMNSDSVPPKYNTNRWSMPTSATLSTMGNSFTSPARKATSTMGVQQSAFGMQPPTEDRYAALKDLDSLMKTQQASSEPQLNEWSTVSTAANAWSINGPGVMGGTVYGSPSQAGYLNAQAGGFGETTMTNTVSTANPFTGEGAFGWSSVGVSGMPNGQVLNGGLPNFHPSVANFPTSQSMNFPAKTWHANPAGNPFVLGASPAPTGHSSNPFL